MQLSVAGTIVLLKRFDAERYLNILEQERVTWSFVVPTMLHRLLQLPPEQLRAADLSSLEVLLLTGAATPAHLKLEAIELFGPPRVWEAYGATEVLCSMIRGDEWLQKPKSVGRPLAGVKVQVLDESGAEVPARSVGEVFIKPPLGPRYSYQGGDERIVDGWISVGDLGYVDEDGYLYIVDRRTDMIVSGGSNVYCSEVEEAILGHPDVADTVVIGLPDDEWGQRVHAIVEPVRDVELSADVLRLHCKSHLAPSKVPKSFEFVDEMPREPSGKVRRTRLISERVDSPPDSTT